MILARGQRQSTVAVVEQETVNLNKIFVHPAGYREGGVSGSGPALNGLNKPSFELSGLSGLKFVKLKPKP